MDVLATLALDTALPVTAVSAVVLGVSLGLTAAWLVYFFSR